MESDDDLGKFIDIPFPRNFYKDVSKFHSGIYCCIEAVSYQNQFLMINGEGDKGIFRGEGWELISDPKLISDLEYEFFIRSL
jgi:hypothetical protein